MHINKSVLIAFASLSSVVMNGAPSEGEKKTETTLEAMDNNIAKLKTDLQNAESAKKKQLAILDVEKAKQASAEILAKASKNKTSDGKVDYTYLNDLNKAKESEINYINTMNAVEGVHSSTDDSFMQHIDVGVRMLNPYSFNWDSTTNKGTLGTGKIKTTGYAEYAFDSRTAWSESRIKEQNGNGYLIPGGENTEFSFSHLDCSFKAYVNFSDLSKASSGAGLGNGDFGLDIKIMYPFYRKLNNPDFAWTIGPVLGFGLDTLSSDYTILKRGLVGLDYSLSCINPVNSENGRIYYSVRAGWAPMNAPQIIGPNREIKTDGNRPDYPLQNACAIETEFIYPVTKGTHLLIGFNAYTTIKPNSWSAYVGLTTSVDRLIGGISSALGGGTGNAPKPPSQPTL